MGANNNNHQLSRVPQNLSFDKDALTRTFGEESAIIRDIIVYAANCQLKDLWGNITFSIEDFCKEFGYSRTTLQRTLEQFKSIKKGLPIIDEHVFDSLFEYALYRALKENVVFKRKRGDKETFESVQLISSLDVIYDKTTKKISKRLYSIKLGNKIMENLFNEYNLIDFQDYKRLKSHKISSVGALRNFYIFIARMIAQIQYERRTKGLRTYIVSIDELCTIFGVNFDTPKNKKSYISKTLDFINASLVNTKFEWEYVKNGTRYNYFVEFFFSDDTLSYFDEKLKAVFFKKLHSAAQQLYLQENGGIGNFKSMADAYKNIDKESFYAWFFSNEGREKKDKIFYTIFNETYGIDPQSYF